MANEIKNPYIMVDVDDESLTEISNSIETLLKDFNVPYERIQNSHISLAYVIGDEQTNFLNELVKEIAEDKFTIKPTGLKILEGKTSDYDYIVLQLETNNPDFEYAYELICETCDVNDFNGNFNVHLSLFKVEKGLIPKKDWFNFCRVLEIYGADTLSSMTIKGQSIAVFSQDKKKQIEKKIVN